MIGSDLLAEVLRNPFNRVCEVAEDQHLSPTPDLVLGRALRLRFGGSVHQGIDEQLEFGVVLLRNRRHAAMKLIQQTAVLLNGLPQSEDIEVAAAERKTFSKYLLPSLLIIGRLYFGQCLRGGDDASL